MTIAPALRNWVAESFRQEGSSRHIARGISEGIGTPHRSFGTPSSRPSNHVYLPDESAIVRCHIPEGGYPADCPSCLSLWPDKSLVVRLEAPPAIVMHPGHFAFVGFGPARTRRCSSSRWMVRLLSRRSLPEFIIDDAQATTSRFDLRDGWTLLRSTCPPASVRPQPSPYATRSCSVNRSVSASWSSSAATENPNVLPSGVGSRSRLRYPAV